MGRMVDVWRIGRKSLAGKTEWNIEVIFPEESEMTIVAAVIRPETTARVDARTVTEGWNLLLV